MSNQAPKMPWLLALVISYVAGLSPFYLTGYHPPDHVLYMLFGEANLPAKDGFSSLFLLIASQFRSAPQMITYAMLIMLACTLCLIFLASWQLLRSRPLINLACTGTISMGIWYYAYGKLFYDFPFTALTYGLCLLSVAFACQNENPLISRPLTLGALFLAGLCLSWKPYNLFAVAGLGLTITSSKASFKNLRKALPSINYKIIGLLLFATGFTCGNFHLIGEFSETVSGLRAYPASGDLSTFFALGHPNLWDHVGNAPFNKSTIAIPSAIIFLIALPIIEKNKARLCANIFMTTSFLVFVKFFSPGFAWHGFTFGLYIITSLVFSIKDVQNASRAIQRRHLCAAWVGVAIQIINNFASYLPQEIRWLKRTNEAITVMHNNNKTIEAEVRAKAQILQDSFTLATSIKRLKFIGKDESKTIGRDRSPAPISESLPNGWASVYQLPNYVKPEIYPQYISLLSPFNRPDGKHLTKYIIQIEATKFSKLSSVVMNEQFVDYKILSASVHDDYTIRTWIRDF